MKVAIIGGKLQGTEAAYLASLAGMESILIDRNPNVPASGICGRFVCGDIAAGEEAVVQAIRTADFVLPANENDAVLDAVTEICRRENLKIAFDYDAYQITKSKIRSDLLMHEHGIPCPKYYPEGSGPYIIKPSGESGSAGVVYAKDEQEVEKFLAGCRDRENWIVQEYLTGPSYSIEVIGNGREYRTYTITQIHMDDVYDCCKVTAPCLIEPHQKEEFARIGEKLARLVNLKGIMDVEVIEHNGELRVLEIDARIPSQTPIAVYYASGVNLLSELADITLFDEFRKDKTDYGRFAAYEHYKLENGRIVQEGEHMMADAGPLHLEKGLFGSKVVVSDYEKGGSSFRGIFVNWADSQESLEKMRNDVKENLKLLL